ncbi:cytochrome P450 [Nonomuraea rubra]|uniref:cytochrome P450 n=1 Tax=Nonomuraea rubra TaxID=46180 RepID=UPI0031ECB985
MSVDDRFGPDLEEARKNRPLPTISEIVTDPVSDWAGDFSHVDPVWAADPYPIQDDLRQRCPIAHTERFGGVWLPTRYEDVVAVAYDTERFSSRGIIVSNVRPPAELAPMGSVPPISSDPPFPPRRAQAAAARVHQERGAQAGGGDAGVLPRADRRVRGPGPGGRAHEYAQHIPVRVIANLLGLPPEDGPLFRRFIETPSLESVNRPPEERADGFAELADYLLAQIRDHVDHPRDDLITYLVDAELYGHKLRPRPRARHDHPAAHRGHRHHVERDRASLWHLARTPRDRERLVAEPGLLPAAMEELLRAYAPVTMARLVKQDMRWNGVDMKAEDWVLLSFPAANRDPAQFERADEVVIDREVTGTPRSGWASTGAWARTWRAWSCGWRWRCGWSGFRCSRWRIRRR